MYAIVDIETTGGQPFRDKIIEIGIVIHDGAKIVNSYSSLINPGIPIPWEITRLTGITDRMVREAPKFYEIAKEIVELTNGSVFVAHNVRFDYSFIKHEFAYLGYKFKRERLCTVRLAQKLVQGHQSYSLGRICADLGIAIDGRHRALGDATATAHLLDHILQKHHPEDLRVHLEQEMKRSHLPPNLPEDEIDTLPGSPGVYYFYDKNKAVLYVGKSNNIRKRILQHLSYSSSAAKAVEFKAAIHSISYVETGTELIAELLESAEIKKIQPPYNEAGKKSVFPYGIFSDYDEEGYLCLYIEKVKPNGTPPIMAASSLRAAKDIINGWVNTAGLCMKKAGLDHGAEACFYRQIDRCDGACIGAVTPEEYNARLDGILAYYRLSNPNLLIMGKGRWRGERSLVLIQNGEYQGFGYVDNSEQIHPYTAPEFLTHRESSQDVRRIINRFLAKTKRDKTFELIPFTWQPALQ